MPVDPFWECIRAENYILSTNNSSLRPLPPGVFEPGDFAYSEESLSAIFNEYLERKGYQLRPAEERVFNANGRYCIVLRRLSADKYVVCYLATFGGAITIDDIHDPVGQYFGFPLGGQAMWNGLYPLKTVPRWRASSGGAYILGIPVIREGLQNSNLGKRFRLALPELTRLVTLIRERDQVRIKFTSRNWVLRALRIFLDMLKEFADYM
ncbi:hypothetical protein H0H81_003332 [Sphagnurus paluster]|uniref:Uncharacterized protein n=1 Tax=Sphagnurus paluster TaxID=117069 RepID=A0A9P7FYW3_9AGAR|nr:hypothetical protein H0H81_003332 [Sphagnurus paluster]